VETGNKAKLHIHTNQPDSVIEKIKTLPEVNYEVEDMQSKVEKIGKKPLGLVVDAIADLPKEFLEKYNIEEVPFTTRFPQGDIITSRDEIYRKMKEALIAGKPLPTTSAPTFKDFLSAYNRAFKRFKRILVITVSSKLSGAYSSARIARATFQKPRKLDIYVFDSFTGEIAEGLIGYRAQELMNKGTGLEEVVEELKKFCPRVTLIATIDDFKYVVRGGRVRLPKFMVWPVSSLQRIGIRPIIILKEGRAKLAGIRFGRNMAQILAEEVVKMRNGKRIKVAIAQADNPEAAEDLKKKLETDKGAEVLFVSSVSPVVGTHTGPGALLVAFYPVDN
jgi:DegV family protein with EDD domain